MGLILCKIHGESGLIPYVSNAIYARFKDASQKSQPIDIAVVNILLKIEDDYSIEQKYYFTKEEFDVFTLKNRYTIQTDDDESSLNTIMKDKFHPMCVKCFNNFMTETGHANLL